MAQRGRPKKNVSQGTDVKDNPVKDWLEKIQKARKVKEAWREKFRIELAYEYRDGAQKPPEVSINEWITINKIYSNLKAELPSLYSTDPYFFIKLAKTYNPHPMTIAQYEQRGKMRQSMLNYLKRELKLKEKVRLSILDAFFQYGIGKVHYSADTYENPEKGQPLLDDDGVAIVDESGEVVMQPENLTANEAYKITRVHPDDFGWDADAGTLPDTWSFLYEIIRMPLDEAKEYKNYKKSARKSLKATEVEKDQIEKEREQRKKGNRQQEAITPSVAVMYEVYDLKENQWFVVSDGCDEYLIDPDEIPKGTEEHPYEILRLGLLRDDSPYPVPPVSQQLDPQREYCELRSKILAHRKRFNRKYEMVDSAFDDPDTAASMLENGGDGTVLRRNSNYPGQAVFPIADATLDQNHIQEILMLGRDLEELSTGANQRGYGAGVDSATEAGIIEKRITIREGDNMGLVMDFTTGIGQKLDQLVQAYIQKDQAVKVIGPEGEYWELIRTTDYEDIEGEYEYTVNTGSTIPHLPEIERAQFMQFLGLIATAPFLATSKRTLKIVAEMHRIEDETLIEELFNIAQKMMGAQPPGRGGSPPGGPDPTTQTMSAMGGRGAGINNIRGGA